VRAVAAFRQKAAKNSMSLRVGRRQKMAADCHPPLRLFWPVAAFGRQPLNNIFQKNMVCGIPFGTLEPMLKTLFRYSRVSSRRANGPLAQERSTSLSHLQTQGRPRSTPRRRSPTGTWNDGLCFCHNAFAQSRTELAPGPVARRDGSR